MTYTRHALSHLRPKLRLDFAGEATITKRRTDSNVIDFAAAALRHKRWVGVKRGPPPSDDLRATLRQLEATFGVRLVAYDPDRDTIVYGGAFLDAVAQQPQTGGPA